jgi:hypothetical protein
MQPPTHMCAVIVTCNAAARRGALQSIEMETQQVVSKPCAAEVSQAAALPGADAAAAEGQTAVGGDKGALLINLRRTHMGVCCL